MKGTGGEQKRLGDEGLFLDAPLALAAAHELKAPLALIRQLSLGLEQGGLSDDERQRIVRQILLTSERGLRLTSDLTRAARLEDSLFELEPLNPRQLCDEVAHELTPLFRAKNRELQVRSGRGQLLVVGNRELLRRIVINFTDNALQYAEANTPVVLKASSVGGEYIRVGVRDYGPAVPSDVWKRIRQRLGTAPQSLQNRPTSSGLGLYVAGQFADAMRGSIGATRHRDGATFYVDLSASRQLALL